MGLIYGEDERLTEWARQRIGHGMRFKPDAKAIGREKDGEIVAAVIFDSFSAADVNMHVASDGSKRWMSRELITAAFAYPFVQCELRRVTGLVPATNIQAITFDLKIGFKIEGRCREALPDDDIVVLGMLRRECPWIPEEYRQ